MYIGGVPNLTIYVDRELEADIRAHGVPISLTCQRALRRQARIAQRRQAAAEAAATRAAHAGHGANAKHRPAS